MLKILDKDGNVNYILQEDGQVMDIRNAAKKGKKVPKKEAPKRKAKPVKKTPKKAPSYQDDIGLEEKPWADTDW